MLSQIDDLAYNKHPTDYFLTFGGIGAMSAKYTGDFLRSPRSPHSNDHNSILGPQKWPPKLYGRVPCVNYKGLWLWLWLYIDRPLSCYLPLCTVFFTADMG
jgi:hypothetical protein